MAEIERFLHNGSPAVNITLITTTISVPHVISLYRRHAPPGTGIVVALERETPHELHEFLHAIDARPVLGESYTCSPLIGWNCIQRRNIALLEAIRRRTEIIVTVDDDNIPMDNTYFEDFESVLCEEHEEWDGLGVAASSRGWFNPGILLEPPLSHRGFPVEEAFDCALLTHVTGARVGVAAGLVLGDSDVDAVWRLANDSVRTQVSEVGRAGVVVDPHIKTVFNSQNTAFVRELAPAMFCPPGVGRYDDIVASLIAQRVMRHKGYYTHFGKPFVWQHRNVHDLRRDLREELWGYENIERLAAHLDNVSHLAHLSVVGMLRVIWESLRVQWFPERAVNAAIAFLDDCEGVL